MLIATLLFTLTAQTTWADTAVTLQQDGSEYFVNMLSSGTSVLTLSNANITTFKVYDDGGKNGHYAYTGNSYLKITVPAGYVMRITGSAKSEDNQYDYWYIYNGHVYSDGILFNGNPNPASINVQTTGNKTSIYFHKGKSSYSDDSRNLELTVTLVDLTKDITQATVTGIEDLYYYTGAVIPLNYSVIPYNGSTPLTKGTDFTETITKGGVAAEVNEPGDYTLTITGQNPYFGSQTFDFTVWNLMQDWMQDGSDWYVTVPGKHTKILTITAADIAAGKTTFKVYDADGKDGVNSKKDWDGTLVINAPANYLVQLSGIFNAVYRGINELSLYGTLTVYDNNEASGTTLIDNNTELNYTGLRKAIIPTVTSSGQSMAIRFESSTWCNKALDLTVTLLPANNKYGITIPNNITGGSVTSNLNEAKVNDEVTLTVTPDEGYMLNDLTVTDADGAAVSVTDCNWYTDWSNTSSKTATFKMPSKAVTVAASFTNILSSDEGGLYVNMPHTGTKNVVIPYNNTSFKLYDDGGKDGAFLKMSDGTLVITAPEGSILNISGKSHLYYNKYHVESNYAIINGTPDNSGAQMVSENNTWTEKMLTGVVSTGNTVYVRFASWAADEDEIYSTYGLDLTVEVTNPNTNYNVNINGGIANGTVTRDKTQAQPNETVNVTATPDEGYVLKDISASDAGGAISMTKPAADGQWGDVVYYTATNGYSFKMRSSDATVNATFMPKTDFFVNMPKTDQRDFTIPAGTTSFKVYDNSGKNGSYFINDNGKLLLTAPEGYAMEVAGYVKLYYSSDDQDYLDIYDGNSTSATSLGRFKNTSGNSGSQTNTVSATSSNNQMLLHFVTNSYGYVNNGGGVYLTITLVPIEYAITYDGLDGATIAPANPTSYTIESDDFTLTNPTRDGYTFAGWTGTGLGAASTSVTVTKGNTGTRSYTATWTENVATLTEANPIAPLTAWSGQQTKVNFTRSGLTAGAYSTICLPYNFTASETCTFYKFDGVKKVGDDWVADISTTTGGTANTPYIFTTDATSVTFSNNAVVAASSYSDTDAKTTITDWTFQGTYSQISLPKTGEYDYGFAAGDGTTVAIGTFVHLKSGASAAPFRAYLKYTGSDDNWAKAPNRAGAANDAMPSRIIVRIVGADGGTTDIGTLDTRTGEISTGEWFDLNGRRLQGKPSTKGVYINNGKKVVIK